MYTLLVIVHACACVFLVLVVLLQTGKGADMGAVFGGSSSTVFGSGGAGNFLSRLTTATAVIFMLTLGTLMLPAQVTLIPQYVLFHKLNWINTLRPLWVPAWFGGNAFAIFLLRQFMLSIPRELDEAALIDGASYPRIFTRILLPLCKPVLATITVILPIRSAGW